MEILWLEDYHDLCELFKGHLGCVVDLLGCEEPASHLILHPKLLNDYCVRSHVDLLYCFEEPLCCSRPDRQ